MEEARPNGNPTGRSRLCVLGSGGDYRLRGAVGVFSPYLAGRMVTLRRRLLSGNLPVTALTAGKRAREELGRIVARYQAEYDEARRRTGRKPGALKDAD